MAWIGGVVAFVLALVASSDTTADSFLDGEARSLFNGRNLAGWVGRDGEATNWEARDGELRSRPGRDGARLLVTEQVFGDFDLVLEFNAPAGANTGVFFRLPRAAEGRPALVGNEIQIVDESDPGVAEKLTPDRRMGAHYGVAAPRVEPPVLRPGEWQTFRLRCHGSRLKVWIDGTLVQDADLAAYPETMQKSHPGLSRTRGCIGLQSKGREIRFRSLAIVELDA